jgi:SAM-dependent methyltransferase
MGLRSILRTNALVWGIFFSTQALALSFSEWARCLFPPQSEDLGSYLAPPASSALEYPGRNARDLAELKELLGDHFSQAESLLKEGDQVLDVGGGFSVYGLELAQRGINVTSINIQDFYQDAFYPLAKESRARSFLKELNQDGIMSQKVLKSEAGNIQGIHPALFRNMNRALDVPLPSFYQGIKDTYIVTDKSIPLEKRVAELQKFVTEAQTKVEELEKAGRFKRVVAYAQEVLPKIQKNSRDEIIDGFGAYYYSSDRLNLLEHYYRILKPGAKAYITVGTGDVIFLPDQSRKDFYQYLAETYPDIFQLDSSKRVRTLIMTKGSSKIKKILGRFSLLKDVIKERDGGVQYHSLVFRLKP